MISPMCVAGKRLTGWFGAKKQVIYLLLGLLLPLSGQANESTVGAFPLTDADVASIKQAFANRFSGEDVDRLIDYFRVAVSGEKAVFPSELKQRLLSAITELRLEHGFQMTVVLAQLKKAAQSVRNEELDEILKELEHLLVD
jgi:hypothetical protein